MSLLNIFRQFKKRKEPTCLEQVFPHLKNTSLIYICGDVGKSSIAYKLSKVLSASDLSFVSCSVGLEDVKESIKVDGNLLSDEEYLEYLSQGEAVIKAQKLSLSKELLLFIIALLAVDKHKVKFFILEDHDKLDPKIALLFKTVFVVLLTSISSIRKLYPIIPYSSTWIIGSKVQDHKLDKYLKTFSVKVQRGFNMGGFYDDENMDLASLLLKVLSKDVSITDELICKHIRERPQGRFEVIPQIACQQKGCLHAPAWTIFDKASNKASLVNFLDTVYVRLPSFTRWVIIDAEHFQDQDINFIIKYGKKYVQHMALIMSHKQVIAKELIEDLNLLKYQTRQEALEAILLQPKISQDLVMICGSDLLIDEAKLLLKINETKKTQLGLYANLSSLVSE